MRDLTIKRTKTFVGCLMKLKVYIEDPASDEIVIDGTPCRKLGTLKNGEEQTFQVEEQSLKVFVIADKLSKNYCNDFYQLPEGQEPISLSGRPRFNLFTGNAFRFDNNNSEAVVKNRKRGWKKGLIVFSIFVVLGAVGGYLATTLIHDDPAKAEGKDFSANGMTITLTEDFSEREYIGYSGVYTSPDVAVFALREAFTLAPGFGNKTTEEYAQTVLQNNGKSGEIKTKDGLVYFEFNNVDPSTRMVYHYVAYSYKTSDAFWLVQFATQTTKADDYAEAISKWAKSVRFSD